MSRDDKGTNQQRKMEREMRLGMMTSRRAIMERERAMDAARNPGVSRFGDCLISVNSKGDTMLKSHLRKLNSEIRRMEIQLNSKMKHFVKTSAVLNHEPLILVERPASPEAVKRAAIMTLERDTHGYPSAGDDDKPSYMRQLRSKAKTPSTLTTIDAFIVKTRKKKNVWEDAADGKPQFQSTVRPYAKLTQREESDLQKGYELHKPKLEPSGFSDGEDAPSKRLPTPKKKVKRVSSDESDLSDFDEVATPFITQMAEVRHKKGGVRKAQTIAEISLAKTSPVARTLDPTADNTLNNEKNVRFKSPLLNSAPTSREKKTVKKSKTKETFFFVQQS
ncbi:uncharacterized protein LOC127861090 isoform X1 [Dreissena polymorpha]|uniref:Uncharacterized protein n=1 Tax=Dreissena polymorpha TaxID=45954 RepID=A0A9D3YNX8_DREPO|nr:uncharacterized protein LOC127861090 isoform X1 [Dreissena polymorpha]KAH3703461.1 hypothetical protein DPMN_078497 [Dreissena polymorpha]